MEIATKAARDTTYLLYAPQYVPRPFGMNNTGVICWCNSLLQSLLSMPALTRTILERECEMQNNVFARAYISLLKQSRDDAPAGDAMAELSNASSFIINAFIARLKQQKSAIDMGRGQECVSEAFTMFIDMLDSPHISRLFSTIYQYTIRCVNCGTDVSTVRDEQFYIHMFTRIPLDTPDKFCGYLRAHPSLCETYRCDKCGHVMSNFHRAEHLKRVREIIVILFNKFHAKDNQWFPRELTFNNGSAYPQLKYKLVATLEHSGGINGGHYWAQALRADGWHTFNDTYVGPASGDPTPNTYMICYHMY